MREGEQPATAHPDAIDWICRAPSGLIAVEDIPPTEFIRGLMW